MPTLLFSRRIFIGSAAVAAALPMHFGRSIAGAADVQALQNPFPLFLDLHGQALDAGFIYIGPPGEDPERQSVPVFWDAAGSRPAAQPLRTRHGLIVEAGLPRRPYGPNSYSIRVRDAGGRELFYEPLVDATVHDDQVSFAQTGAGAVASTVRTKLLHGVPVCAFDFMTGPQIADVQAYTRRVDVTAAVQAAMNAAWASNRDCFLPAGAYLVRGLTMPGTAARRARAFRLFGQGTGEIFARDYAGGTILHSSSNAPVLRYECDLPNTGGGNVEVDHLRFEGNSATPVVDFEALYAQSSFHHNAIYQAGRGDGFVSRLSNTIEIHNNYAINGDWNRGGLGAARTGAGFRILQSIETGLTTLRKNTARGFKAGYVLGDGAVGMYAPKIEDCECSVVHDGILISANVRSATIRDNYLEGGDGGTGIKILGNYARIDGNLIFAGFGVGIDDSGATAGTVIANNILSAASVANSRLLRIHSQGGGKSVRSNTFTFSGSGGSIPGVVAISVTGTNPDIDFGSDNYIDGAWSGGAGTVKISDRSTTTPASVADGKLIIDDRSSYTLASAGRIDGFTGALYPGTQIDLHLSNGGTTLVHGAGLKLSGGVDFTAGAGGSWHCFHVKPGGGTYEISRLLY